MANRCTLYALDFVPETSEGVEKKTILLAEHAYEIPLVFKILASASPRICLSLDWPDDGNVAILGDLPHGRDRLFTFLDQLDNPLAQPLIEEAKEALSRPELQLPYILLEPLDIFQMSESDFLAATRQLLEEIEHLEELLPERLAATLGALSIVVEVVPKRRWPWQKPPKQRDPLQPLYELGLGNWG